MTELSIFVRVSN